MCVQKSSGTRKFRVGILVMFSLVVSMRLVKDARSNGDPL